MRSLASPSDPVTLDSVGAQHSAQRQVHRFQYRSLLDVELEIRGSVLELPPGLGRAIEVHAVRADRFGQRDSVAVGQLSQLVLVSHRARRRTGAEKRTAEARPLLVGPADEADRHRRLALPGDPAEDLGAGDHVERAVEPPAVGNRVEVPADQQLLLRPTSQRPPLVPRLVEGHLGTGPFELPGHPVLRLHPRVRPGHSLSAVLVAGQLAELLQVGDGT
jgi:hypothetical protein